MKLAGSLVVLLVGVAVGGAKGGLEENLDKPQGRGKHDQIQDDILKAMEDSGVLNEWKDKLDDMLYEGNDIDVGGPEERNYLTKQEETMLHSFVQEYTKENRVKVHSDVIVDIVRRVQKQPSPNLPQIFVQLTPLIDVVSAIGQKTKNLAAIIDRQAPVFESPAKTKDILHTLTENLKSELVRLTLDTPPKNAKPKAAPKKERKPKEKAGLDLTDYLTLGSTLLKGGNAGQIMSLLSGDTDMSSMLSLLPQLIEGGNYQALLGKVVDGYLDGTPYGPMVKNVRDSFVNSEQGKGMMTSGYKYLEMFMKSESGRRAITILPKLTQAKDLDAFLVLVHEEAEWNWAQVFENIENSDYKEKMLEQLATYLVEGYEYLSNPPKGSTMARVPILVNGFLISNGIPMFDANKKMESFIAIANKGIKLFSSVKLDVRPFVTMLCDSVSKAFSRQAKGNSLADLNTTQRVHLLTRLVDTELVEPMQAVWKVYTHSVDHLDCAEHLLCQVNHHERKSNIESRIGVVRASSLAAGWALAQVKQRSGPQYWSLYKEAVWSGSKGDDCMSTYKVDQKACNIFPWQKKEFMSMSYDHNEL